MRDYQRDFLALALERQALKFGEFTLKSGRVSPYFFNAGLFNDGAALARLGRCYAAALADSGLGFDLLFGPAYKGIPLVAACAIAYADHFGRNVPWAFNRKEAKDHGEGGLIVGAPLQGRVLIVDDALVVRPLVHLGGGLPSGRRRRDGRRREQEGRADAGCAIHRDTAPFRSRPTGSLNIIRRRRASKA